MNRVLYTMFEEPARYTIFWKDGTSEVIRAKTEELFEDAFLRNGFSQACLFAVEWYMRGTHLELYKFDRSRKRWIKKVGDELMNISYYISNLVDSSPYPISI